MTEHVDVRTWIAGFCLNEESMEATARFFKASEAVAKSAGWSEALVDNLRRARIKIDIVPVEFRDGDKTVELFVITNFIKFGFDGEVPEMPEIDSVKDLWRKFFPPSLRARNPTLFNKISYVKVRYPEHELPRAFSGTSTLLRYLVLSSAPLYI
jgi:hypothetical protein